MPLNRYNTTVFHRVLYSSELESCTLLKRSDDQQQGTVRAVVLWDIRWSMIHKSGETYRHEQQSNHYRSLHIPRIELDRVGVQYINPLDRFVDQEGRTWQPESGETITIKLFQNHVCVACQMLVPKV